MDIHCLYCWFLIKLVLLGPVSDSGSIDDSGYVPIVRLPLYRSFCSISIEIGEAMCLQLHFHKSDSCNMS